MSSPRIISSENSQVYVLPENVPRTPLSEVADVPLLPPRGIRYPGPHDVLVTDSGSSTEYGVDPEATASDVPGWAKSQTIHKQFVLPAFLGRFFKRKFHPFVISHLSLFQEKYLDRLSHQEARRYLRLLIRCHRIESSIMLKALGRFFRYCPLNDHTCTKLRRIIKKIIYINKRYHL